MRESQVVMITGCSKGIGRDLAIRLTEAGYRVVATARRTEGLEESPAALRLKLDVGLEDEARAAVEEAIRVFGRIDALVNNAGFAVPGAVEDTPEAAMRSMFETNVFGLIRMMRLVAPHMRRQGGGKIVNIGSLSGKWSMAVWGGYSATKYAVEALSDAARQELRGFGIHVALVEPGPIETEFAAGADRLFDELVADPSSAYADFYRRNEAFKRKMRRASAPTAEVSRVVAEILDADRPKARYAVAWPMGSKVILALSDNFRDNWYHSEIEGEKN